MEVKSIKRTNDLKVGDLFYTSWGWEQTGNSGSLEAQVKREGGEIPLFSFALFLALYGVIIGGAA